MLFAGAFVGDSCINIKVRITELPSAGVIAEPEFYRRTRARRSLRTAAGADTPAALSPRW
jgi:hypothetical protein